jgi:hypothetical protein
MRCPRTITLHTKVINPKEAWETITLGTVNHEENSRMRQRVVYNRAYLSGMLWPLIFATSLSKFWRT